MPPSLELSDGQRNVAIGTEYTQPRPGAPETGVLTFRFAYRKSASSSRNGSNQVNTVKPIAPL